MTINATELRARVGTSYTRLVELDRAGHLAAPVDLEAMFQHGIIEAAAPTDEPRRGTLIDGSLTLGGAWKVSAPVWVTGNVIADAIELTSDLVIEGSLTVHGEVRGRFEPNTLTVLGPVSLGRAIMERQFIMQFLGGGTIGELSDDEGAARELLDIMRRAGSALVVAKLGSR
jgi:hypothetical protein